MNITLESGVLFAASMEEVTAGCQEAAESIEALRAKLLGIVTSGYMELADLAVPGYCPTLEEIERAGWQNAAALARSKMAVRAHAFARQMQHQKARQAMKRRKLMHADSSFPDWGCCFAG